MDHPFVQRMMERKYYAFASDYIRLYALEKFGGLYLDADMEIVSSPEPLLTAPCVTAFLSNQNKINKNSVALGFLGACPAHSWIQELRELYGPTTPAVMNTTLATESLRRRGLSRHRESGTQFDYIDLGMIRIYHCDYLYPQREGSRFSVQPRTVAIHHGLAQWGGPQDPFPWWKKIYDLRLDRKILRPVEGWIRRARSKA